MMATSMIREPPTQANLDDKASTTIPPRPLQLSGCALDPSEDPTLRSLLVRSLENFIEIIPEGFGTMDVIAQATSRRMHISADIIASSNYSDEILPLLHPLTLPAGTEVVVQGEYDTNLYIIASGKVSISVFGNEIATLEQGSFFGELSLLFETPRSATVTCIAPCEFWFIDRRSVFRILGIAEGGQETFVRRTKLFTQLKELSGLPLERLQKLISALKAKVFLEGDVLYSAGKSTTKTLLIEEGVVITEIPNRLTKLSDADICEKFGILLPSTDFWSLSPAAGALTSAGCQASSTPVQDEISSSTSSCCHRIFINGKCYFRIGRGAIIGTGVLASKLAAPNSWLWRDEIVDGVPSVGAVSPATFSVDSVRVRATYFDTHDFESLFGPASAYYFFQTSEMAKYAKAIYEPLILPSSGQDGGAKPKPFWRLQTAVKVVMAFRGSVATAAALKARAGERRGVHDHADLSEEEEEVVVGGLNSIVPSTTTTTLVPTDQYDEGDDDDDNHSDDDEVVTDDFKKLSAGIHTASPCSSAASQLPSASTDTGVAHHVPGANKAMTRWMTAAAAVRLREDVTGPSTPAPALSLPSPSPLVAVASNLESEASSPLSPLQQSRFLKKSRFTVSDSSILQPKPLMRAGPNGPGMSSASESSLFNNSSGQADGRRSGITSDKGSSLVRLPLPPLTNISTTPRPPAGSPEGSRLLPLALDAARAGRSDQLPSSRSFAHSQRPLFTHTEDDDDAATAAEAAAVVVMDVIVETSSIRLENKPDKKVTFTASLLPLQDEVESPSCTSAKSVPPFNKARAPPPRLLSSLSERSRNHHLLPSSGDGSRLSSRSSSPLPSSSSPSRCKSGSSGGKPGEKGRARGVGIIPTTGSNSLAAAQSPLLCRTVESSRCSSPAPPSPDTLPRALPTLPTNVTGIRSSRSSLLTATRSVKRDATEVAPQEAGSRASLSLSTTATTSTTTITRAVNRRMAAWGESSPAAAEEDIFSSATSPHIQGITRPYQQDRMLIKPDEVVSVNTTGGKKTVYFPVFPNVPVSPAP